MTAPSPLQMSLGRLSVALAKLRLRVAGYYVHPAASRILIEYGGLTFRFEQALHTGNTLVAKLVMFGGLRLIRADGRPLWQVPLCRSAPAATFLNEKFGMSACYIGGVHHSLWHAPTCSGGLFCFEDGTLVLCPDDWLNLYFFSSIADVVGRLHGEKDRVLREVSFEADSAANRRLTELRLGC